jgi:hypothetical protein
MKRELLLVYPNIIYYIMLIIFILFLVLYVVKISYRLLDIIEFTLLQSIFFIIIFFWKLFILSYVLIFIFIALCNTLYCLYMYINLQKEEHIDIFKHLCNYSGFIGKGWGALFNLNQRLYQNLNYLIILSFHSLFLAPVVDSTLLFYTVLKWSYEKKTYKLNEGYLLFFKMLLLSLVFGITQRLIYVFNLYKIIFSEYPFYTYMCCITSRKN